MSKKVIYAYINGFSHFEAVLWLFCHSLHIDVGFCYKISLTLINCSQTKFEETVVGLFYAKMLLDRIDFSSDFYVHDFFFVFVI